MLTKAVRQVLDLYPRIYYACHTRHVRDAQTEQVLSAHQAGILSHLDDVEPTTLLELAGHLGVTASTMSLAIERLVRQGFVLRQRDPRDRRAVQLRLSEAGVRVKEAQSVLDPERVRAVLRRLSPGDRQKALDGLALLARASQEQMHEQGPSRFRSPSAPSEIPARRTNS
jgi:DNA-binding MarR family transcriptional regulator